MVLSLWIFSGLWLDLFCAGVSLSTLPICVFGSLHAFLPFSLSPPLTFAQMPTIMRQLQKQTRNKLLITLDGIKRCLARRFVRFHPPIVRQHTNREHETELGDADETTEPTRSTPHRHPRSTSLHHARSTAQPPPPFYPVFSFFFCPSFYSLLSYVLFLLCVLLLSVIVFSHVRDDRRWFGAVHRGVPEQQLLVVAHGAQELRVLLVPRHVPDHRSVTLCA